MWDAQLYTNNYLFEDSVPPPPPDMQWLQQPIYGGSYVPLQERGVVDLWKIFLNKEWYERCVEAYNLAAVIDKA